MTDWMAGPAVLFCPADKPVLIGKALARADVVVVDLEDAVDAGSKTSAREGLRALELDWRRALIRVNGPRTPYFAEDLATAATLGVGAVIVPMAEDPEDLARAGETPVIPLIETARGWEAASALAVHEGSVGVMWGSEDLAHSLGSRVSRREDRLTPVMQAARADVLRAAALAGVPAIDAVLPGFGEAVEQALRAESIDAADMGFAAKGCIHPSQVRVIRDAFAPSDDEIAWASSLVGLSATQGGAFAFDGALVDEPILRRARSILAAAGRS